MAPRLSEIRSERHSQRTPAPLLQTRRGQLPGLPAQLAKQAIPNGEILLLQFPLKDWYMLNANAEQCATDLLLKDLSQDLPAGGPPSAASLTGQRDAMIFLTPRAAASRQALCNSPGKSLCVKLDSASSKLNVSPLAAARLHSALKTDFALAPTDAPLLHISPSPNVARKRAVRSIEQVRAFASAVSEADTDSETNARSNKMVFASVQGGVDEAQRRICAEAVAGLECSGGFSIDGLFAGETPDARTCAVQASVSALRKVGAGQAPRLLTGGTGAPWDVLRAVEHGIDIVDSSFPFDMAEHGFATRLATSSPGAPINVRDRRWEVSRDPLVSGCPCFVCAGFMRGYVRHLFEVREMMGVTFLAAHNLFDYLSWFQKLREAIEVDAFDVFARDYESVKS